MMAACAEDHREDEALSRYQKKKKNHGTKEDEQPREVVYERNGKRQKQRLEIRSSCLSYDMCREGDDARLIISLL